MRTRKGTRPEITTESLRTKWLAEIERLKQLLANDEFVQERKWAEGHVEFLEHELTLLPCK